MIEMSLSMFRFYDIIFAILIFVIIFSISPSILRLSSLFLRAVGDYRMARGTMHQKQIRACLKVLDRDIRNTQMEKQKLENRIRKLNQKRSEKILKALSRHLVETRLTEVEGIGQILKERIINYCFDGTLGSLRRAYNLEGIGKKKAKAISKWISKLEREIPHLLKDDFPGKRNIITECENKERELKERQSEIQARISHMNEIRKKASAEKDRLGRVGIFHFIRSYQSNEDASGLVNHYLEGVYPEWEPMPLWFKILISEGQHA